MLLISGRAFTERVFLKGVPRRAVEVRCRAFGLCSDRARDLAEEAAAEAHRRAIVRCFTSEDHYSKWVTRTALNFAIDKIRRMTRERTVIWIVASTREITSEAEVDRETLRKALSILSDEERRVLTLTFDEGLTLDQIADTVDFGAIISPNAKRLRIKRMRDDALCKLRRFLVERLY